ncbi:primosomal protein N' [Pseudahrensia aquimaris]|uniref:Replication restart protein PriA n=1 Tax=Pseudahrensia aquimaris TaxID=744461 RepID=A0ABW3FIG5_9HYPH
MSAAGDDLFGKTQTVFVLLPIPAEQAYSYAVPEGMNLAPGDFVQVPLGPRKVAAVVWDAPDEAKEVDPKKLRPVEVKFDCPPLAADMRKFVDWVAQYTVSSPGMVLRMVLRAPGALDPESAIAGIRYLGGTPERLTDARRRVMELLENDMAWTRSGLAHASGVSTSVVDGLVKQGLFEDIEIPPGPVVPPPFRGEEAEALAVALSDDQRAVSDALVERVREEKFSCTLLDGVTGSGKTEVYFEAIAAALEQGRQVLILLPEIALTSTFLDRFEERFGAPPAQWHSGLAPKTREKVWRQVAEGRVRVVAGARSALFLPFCEPGLIIVDEEHDSAYKQEDRVFYNARDMAVVRASLGNFPCVLASATPSVESRVNAQTGRYHHERLEARHADAVLPDLSVIDMRKDPPPRGKFISPVLTKAMEEALGRGEQALLFLNRRGYAPLTLCRVCGHRFECKNCSAWLVEHRFRNQLQCHHCGHSEQTPEACPECGTLDHLVACGPGVERLAEEVDETFPDARIIVLSSDMLGGVTRLRLELEAIAKGEADIIIGTQLVAKGHNFPLMTCVGVVDADLGLANGDPRAAERTFQLLSQVTGRAGRAGGASVGLLQSYAPEHPVIQAIEAGDREAFYEREIGLRQSAGLPPFARLAAIIVSGEDKRAVEVHAREMKFAAPQSGDVHILGPAEAPMALVRGRHRYRLLVHAPRAYDLQSWLRAWLAAGPKERGSVRVQVDVDPQSFL